MSNFDFLEDYFESIDGNKITIVSGIEENDEMYSFKYCLFSDFTETSIAEINKKEFLKWVEEHKMIIHGNSIQSRNDSI
jgi:hypothetical protein